MTGARYSVEFVAAATSKHIHSKLISSKFHAVKFDKHCGNTNRLNLSDFSLTEDKFSTLNCRVNIFARN